VDKAPLDHSYKQCGCTEGVDTGRGRARGEGKHPNKERRTGAHCLGGLDDSTTRAATGGDWGGDWGAEPGEGAAGEGAAGSARGAIGEGGAGERRYWWRVWGRGTARRPAGATAGLGRGQPRARHERGGTRPQPLAYHLTCDPMSLGGRWMVWERAGMFNTHCGAEPRAGGPGAAAE